MPVRRKATIGTKAPEVSYRLTIGIKTYFMPTTQEISMPATTTTRLSLPLLAAAQAQKHVTHNEALVALDSVIQLSAVSRTLTTAPSNAVQGARYLVAANATAPWAGKSDKIACFEDGGWQFLTPQTGWRVFVSAEQLMLVYDGAAWVDMKIRSADMLGNNTSADANTRLSVSSNGSLLSHAGSDHQLRINKAGTGNVASLIYQTGFSGRAEMGLAGSDDFRIKTSPDGAAWQDALIASRTTGEVRFPAGLVDANTGLKPAMLMPSLVKDIWRSDMDSPATPRTYTVASISSNVVTLTTNEVEQFFNVGMQNATMVRIWSMSKSPAQAAWVTWNISANAFSVSSAADIASWAAGESLRLGDPNPTGTNALSMVALDLSNYLQAAFGTVFRQRGLKISLSVAAVNGRANMSCSGTGAVGTAFGSSSNNDGSSQSSFLDVFTSVQSPISNSNRLFIRESLVTPATAMGATRLMRLVGVWV